ncbi:MAG TPA: type II secretion system F family protein [Bryobacteraceae bacterium]|nr:type II secretion system F family protein [Bryobacteraceae bacterium]
MHALLIFGGFFLVVMAATGLLGYAVVYRERAGDGENTFLRTLGRIGGATPVRAEESGRLRERLSFAGYRQASATTVYSGTRVALAASMALVLLLTVAIHAGSLYRALLAGICAALVGFMLPDRVLDRHIRLRGEKLRAGLPTALDLLVLCLEAGQSLDAALIETSLELKQPFPELHDELSLVQKDIFASQSRAEAFRNLAKRNRETEIRRLAQVLIDGDRFGTSLAPALRTHVRYLRLRMRQKAREAARKVGVKLIFPLFFLIFPALLLVTLGPAVLQVISQLAPMLTSAAP